LTHSVVVVVVVTILLLLPLDLYSVISNTIHRSQHCEDVVKVQQDHLKSSHL